MTQSTRAILVAALTIAGNSGPGWAESYCVACYGPDAVYRCVVAGAPESAPPDPRNQVQCIKQLAKQGSHARCSVERFSTNGCNGPERTISPTASALPIAPAHDARSQSAAPSTPQQTERGPQQYPSGSEPAAAEPTSTGDEPPQTVEELAKSTVETTKKSINDVTGSVKASTEQAGEKIEGVGSTIGHAAKKSWNCLTSLFNDC